MLCAETLWSEIVEIDPTIAIERTVAGRVLKAALPK
jgi:hypothetical protein